jgi:rhodanese-related sulfurtransferase
MNKNTYKALGILGILVLVIALIASLGTTTRLPGGEFVQAYSTTPNAVLIDVRTPSEFESGHIANALNIDFESSSFETEIQKLDTSKEYFVYCRSGNRSQQAISVMKSHGIDTVYELRGGIIANQKSIQLVTSTIAEPEYVVDASDMIDGASLVSVTQPSKLSSDELAGLILMREEEKLAHDVYTTLGDTWGLKIFDNIAASEQTHTDAMKALLASYDIEDPVRDTTIGVFTAPTMQKLYTDLTSQGKASLVDALIVGATIEDLDINDLETLKQSTTKPDILATYNNLQKGSRNHLRAFVRNIQARGSTYTPQYISANEFSSIISSPQERGRY